MSTEAKSGVGAPVGNKNATKNAPWKAAIHRALAKRSRIDQREALDEIAEAFLAKCGDGDMVAIKELGDRLDGRAKQQVTVSGEDGGAIQTSLTIEFKRSTP